MAHQYTEKELELHFKVWEEYAFGHGYGTGEPSILEAVKKFLDLCDHRHMYDYEVMEKEFGELAAWLLINALCRMGIINYTASARYGTLSREGIALKKFMGERGAEALYEIVMLEESDEVKEEENPFLPDEPFEYQS